MKHIITVFIVITVAASTILLPKGAYCEENKGFKKFQLMPQDDSVKDKEFSNFITKFKKDVKSRNIDSLKKSISADITWNFGDNGGIKGFIKNWNLDKNPKNSPFWDEIDKVLSLGSAFYNEEKTSHAFPYLFVTFPADYDQYEFAALTGKKVNIRKEASSKAAVIETLDYEIVKPVASPDPRKKETVGGFRGEWIEVTTASGKTGYVFSRFIHSSIWYRAIFEKKGKAWILTAFISGD